MAVQQPLTKFARPPEYAVPQALRVQRRLLFTFTFVLLAIHLLNVKIAPSATVQGLVLTFERPWLLVVAAWVSWVWAFWRYWQQERQFSLTAYESSRYYAYRDAASVSVTFRLQEEVDRGTFESRGVKRGTPIRARVSFDFSTEMFDFPAGAHHFTSVSLDAQTPDRSGWSQVAGGANCELDANDMAKVRRRAEASLKVRNPYFADIRLPYWIALLAPCAGIFDLARWLMLKY